MDALVDLKKRVAHLEIEGKILPRRAELVVVLQDVLIDAVEGHGRGHAGSADRGFEAVGAGDGVVGEDAAVAPAGDGEAIGIGDADGDGFVDAGEQVFDFVVAPVGGDGLGVVLAAAGAAAVVHVELGVALGGEPLAQEVEAVLVLSVGAAVDEEDHGDGRARP